MFRGDRAKSSVLLFVEAREQIDAEWKNMLSHTQLFPMKITDKSKYSKKNCPRPFPKLVDLCSTDDSKDKQVDQEQQGTNVDTPSCTATSSPNKIQQKDTLATTYAKTVLQRKTNKQPILNNFVISKPKPINITRAKSSGYGLSNKTSIPISKPTRPRPISAPSSRSGVTGTKIPRCFISNFAKTNSADRLKEIQISRINLQTFLDDRDLSNINVTIPERSESSQRLSPLIKFPTSCGSTTSVMRSKSESATSAAQICRRRSSHTIQQNEGCDNHNESLESSGDLIVKGLELLAKGKDIIETSKQAGRIDAQTLHQVAETLNNIVNGELKLLKEENKTLRTANDLLNKQLLAFTKISETYAIDPIESHKRYAQRSPMQTTYNTVIPNMATDELPGKEIVNRLSALEDTVGYIMESHNTQTTKLQDRLFEQEVRYEETLEKFEEVIGNMTNMFAGLQETYNIQTNKNGISKSATAFKDVLISIAKASPSKKVQFKGILKP